MKSLSISRVSLWLIGLMIVTLMMASNAQGEFIYGAPVKVSQLYSPYGDSNSQISPNGLELYFVSNRPYDGQDFKYDIWVASRPSIEDDWNPPVRMPDSINTAEGEFTPCLSPDGLTLFFAARVAGNTDLWYSTRAALESPWSDRINLGDTINTEYGEDGPHLSADGLSLYFTGHPGGASQTDIYVTTRQTKADPWGPPAHLGQNVNTSQFEFFPFISPDGLALYFSRGMGINKCFVCRRESQMHAWGPAVEFAPVNMPGYSAQNFSYSSADSTLYFVAYTNYFDPSTFDTWQIEVAPIVDLNGDGQVDVQDVTLMVEHWGEDFSSCDISPFPMGDGVVDANDLEVLMSHWGEDANFIAHWKLDETGGDIAYDSVAENDAVVMGDALWQRESGQVEGALQFDGIDDYLIAPFILNPPMQPFSVFAWIKGGQPEQTIISQYNGFGEWLSLDAAGALTSTLTFPLPAVTSDVVITDDLWHRIGLVSDGSGISLCVDDVEVARSETSPVLPATGDLQIGTGKVREPGTFWSGLIDDVRVYNRVVVP